MEKKCSNCHLPDSEWAHGIFLRCCVHVLSATAHKCIAMSRTFSAIFRVTLCQQNRCHQWPECKRFDKMIWWMTDQWISHRRWVIHYCWYRCCWHRDEGTSVPFEIPHWSLWMLFRDFFHRVHAFWPLFFYFYLHFIGDSSKYNAIDVRFFFAIGFCGRKKKQQSLRKRGKKTQAIDYRCCIGGNGIKCTCSLYFLNAFAFEIEINLYVVNAVFAEWKSNCAWDSLQLH